MENNIDKLFREGLGKKKSPFNEAAWDRLAIPEQERKRRVGLWWWFGFLIVLIGLIAWVLFKCNDNQSVIKPLKEEFASLSDQQSRVKNIDPGTDINSESSVIAKKEDGLHSMKYLGNVPIAELESKERQEKDIPAITDVNKITEKDKNDNSDRHSEDSTIRNEFEIAKDAPFIKDEMVADPREVVLISSLNNSDLYLNIDDRFLRLVLSDKYRIEPLQGHHQWMISGLVEVSRTGRLGGGLTLSWKGRNRIFLKTAVLYNYQSEDDRLIASERIASYGFGRSISERQFRSQHLHMISIPFNIGLSKRSWDGYVGVRADYLSGVRGTVSVDSESSVTSSKGWIKEYGYNRFSLDLEMGLMKKVSRNLGLGIRMGYPIVSRYNVDYFNNSNLQLENNIDINISLQLQYDLIR